MKRLLTFVFLILPMLMWGATVNTNKTAYPATWFMGQFFTNTDQAGAIAYLGITQTNGVNTNAAVAIASKATNDLGAGIISLKLNYSETNNLTHTNKAVLIGQATATTATNALGAGIIALKQPTNNTLTKISALADAVGMLTNNAGGNLGWAPIPTGGGSGSRLTNATLYVDGVNGNDTNKYPYKTLEAAVADVTNVTTIVLSAGSYTNANVMIMPPNLMIVGQSWENTYVYIPESTRGITLSNNCVVKNLTVDVLGTNNAGPITIGEGISNAVVDNCQILGYTDNVMAFGDYTNIWIRNCIMRSGWDCFLMYPPPTGNEEITIENCDIYADRNFRNRYGTQAIVKTSKGKMKFRKCHFHLNGESSTSLTFFEGGIDSSKFVELTDCTLEYTGTYTTGIGITNAGTATNLVINGTFPMQWVQGPSTVNGNTNTFYIGFGTNISANVTGLVQAVAFKGDGSQLTNISAASTNAYYPGNITNGVNYGDAFRSPGSGANSCQFGTNAEATGASSLAIGQSAKALGQTSMALGYQTTNQGSLSIAIGSMSGARTNSMAIGGGANALGYKAISIGFNSEANERRSISIGPDATANYRNSMAIGSYAVASTSNEVVIGNASNNVVIPGNLNGQGSVIAGTLQLSNVNPGVAVFTSTNGQTNMITVPWGTNGQVLTMQSSTNAAFANAGATDLSGYQHSGSSTNLTNWSGLTSSGYSNGIYSAAVAASGGGGTNVANLTVTNFFRLKETNIVVETTNGIILDLRLWNVFKLLLRTNVNLIFTNAEAGIVNDLVYFQQDTNGMRTLDGYIVYGVGTGLGQVQINASLILSTNVDALDLLEVKSGYWPTNLLAYGPKDFQPRIGATNYWGGIAASITIDPTNLTILTNTTADFYITAAGSPTPYKLWYTNDPVNATNTFTRNADADNQTEESFSSVPITWSNLLTYCVVSNQWGMDTSAVAVLTVTNGAAASAPDSSGLAFWYKPDTLNATNSGDLITTWTDSSGNGYTLAQAGSARPYYAKTNTANGNNYVFFPNSTGLTNLWADTNRGTLWIVAQMTGGANTLYHTGNTNANTMISGNKMWMYGSLGVGATNLPTAGAWSLWTMQYNGTASTIMTNGVLSVSGNTGTYNPTNFTFGNSYLLSTVAWKAGIAEILYYTNTLATNLTTFNYLTNKYGPL